MVIEDFLRETDTSGLLVLKAGEILLERYLLTGGPQVNWFSMSVAKSFVSAGIGIAAVIYNYDGYVYASDESRMSAETGDDTFRLPNDMRNRANSPIAPKTMPTSIKRRVMR